MPRPDTGKDGGPIGASAFLIGNSNYWGTEDIAAGYYPYGHNFSLWEYFGLLRGGAAPTDFLKSSYLTMLRRDCLARGNLSSDPACSSLPANFGAWGFTENMLTKTHNRATFGSQEYNRYVVPYSNPQSLIWDVESENFMDEWTEYDVADPRYGTWNRCWPIGNPQKPGESRFGKLPCPNKTYSWDPKFVRNQTTRNNAEQAQGWRHGRQNSTSL
eukprot:COSAG05_NODE_8464_length_701_cov_1.546512_1_plen_214_part_10